MRKCPCGSDLAYTHCCGTYIEGHALPATPEALMRSRYSAYTKANIDYIEQTMRGAPLQNFDRRQSQQWARRVVWLKLEVIQTQVEDSLGWVEFIAYFAEAGKKQTIHELSEFHFDDGKWYYTDSKDPIKK